MESSGNNLFSIGTSFSENAFSGATDFSGGSGSGFSFTNFFNDPKKLGLLSGGFQAVNDVFSGFQESSLRDSNVNFIENEIQLATEANALDRLRERKRFVAVQKEARAAAAGSGLSGFEDVFNNDAQTFELEQLISKFNNEVFVFGKKQDIALEKFRGRSAITKGFQSASSKILDTISILNPPKQ